MNALESIFLGALQGLTEFLPISSSGHLALFKILFQIEGGSLSFYALLHFGSFFAIVSFFKKEIERLFKKLLFEIKEKKEGEGLKLILLLLIGSLPIVFFGTFFEEKVEKSFESPLTLALAFLATSLLLFLSHFFSKEKFFLEKFSFKNAFIVGLFQAMALIPGASRSGLTVSSSLLLGLKKNDAFYFSFLLGALAILGANLIQIPKIEIFLEKIEVYLFGFFSSFIFSFLALKIFKIFLSRKNLLPFAFYCLFLSLAIFLKFC